GMYAIALDDYGAGYMGLGALLKLRPDLLKLDRVITEGVDQDPVHRVAVKNMVDLGRDLDILVIAEGVETLEEFWALRACGVRYMQGYLLGKPRLAPVKGAVAIPPSALWPMPAKTPKASER
ncbi:MAG: EAL domain-containing protein, partial [Firmicutes bacterium]|nr:EAL domain-containing protein [Bacillota bacterium]